MQVVLVDHLLEPARDRLEVVAGKAAVGREALGEDQEIAAALRETIVVHREEAADVRQAVLLRGHGAAVGEREHLPRDLARRSIALPCFALLDEPGVLGEAAGIEEERLPVAVAERADTAQVLERDRLAAPELFVTVTITRGIRSLFSAKSAPSFSRSMLPLNG